MTSLQKLRKRLRSALPWQTEVCYFYNCAPGRGDRVLARELTAMAADLPAYIGLAEAIGYDLPNLHGYRGIRDKSKPSRANVAMYVRDDLATDVEAWTDLHSTWRRTEHEGRHDPRSFLHTLVGRMPVWVGHAPPITKYGDTLGAQREMYEALCVAMAPREDQKASLKPLQLVWDSNRRADRPGPGSQWLAAWLRDGGARNAKVAGTAIDNAVVVNTQVLEVSYPKTVNGVVLGTDHGHVFRMKFRVWGYWLKRKR